MKILLSILLLPCVFGAHSICSDNKICPEGTKCCSTYDDKIRCCDINNPDSIYVKTSRPLQAVPSTPFLAFVNVTQPFSQYAPCVEGITCRGTCCDDHCCPYEGATCCDGGCCSYYSTCCSGYTKYIVLKRWCCVASMKCGDFDKVKCLSKGSHLAPHLIVVVMTVTFRVWLLKMLA